MQTSSDHCGMQVEASWAAVRVTGLAWAGVDPPTIKLLEPSPDWGHFKLNQGNRWWGPTKFILWAMIRAWPSSSAPQCNDHRTTDCPWARLYQLQGRVAPFSLQCRMANPKRLNHTVTNFSKIAIVLLNLVHAAVKQLEKARTASWGDDKQGYQMAEGQIHVATHPWCNVL